MASSEMDPLFVDRLYSVACRHAAQIGGVREDREDYVQDFVVRMWMRAHTGADGFGEAWLNACARNLATDFRRRILFRQRVQLPYGEFRPRVDGLWTSIAGATLGPEEEAIRGELRAALAAGLASLTPGQRRAVVLRHVEGWTLTEIAATLGRSPAAVSKLVERGVGHLRRRIRRGERSLVFDTAWSGRPGAAG